MGKLEELKAALSQVNPAEVKEQEQQDTQTGFIAQELTSLSGLEDTISIDSSQYWQSNMGSITLNSISSPTYTIKGLNGAQGSSGSMFTSGPNANGWATINTNPSSGLHVTSDAEFDGDIKWKGRSLGEMIESIESRLSILVPDPDKLEKFEALKKAYEHYKLMEKLCHDDPKPTE